VVEREGREERVFSVEREGERERDRERGRDRGEREETQEHVSRTCKLLWRAVVPPGDPSQGVAG